MIITLFFEKNAIFYAENWEKSQKIVVITSTPELLGKRCVCKNDAKNVNGSFSGHQRGLANQLRVPEGEEAPVHADADHPEPESVGRRLVPLQRLQPVRRQQRQHRPQL
jgi:hypothetical protein